MVHQTSAYDRPLAVLCADVGSVKKGRFGWWSSAGNVGGDLPSSLVSHAAQVLQTGQPLALGFECPLFAPLNEDESHLTDARPGEGARPWSAGAGCGALVTGLVQATWVLRELRRRIQEPVDAHLDWHAFVSAGKGLFLWEAFVTAGAKRDTHVGDAQVAVQSFTDALPDPRQRNAINRGGAVLSLIGVSLLRAGWASDPSVLEQPCLVIRADA